MQSHSQPLETPTASAGFGGEAVAPVALFRFDSAGTAAAARAPVHDAAAEGHRGTDGGTAGSAAMRGNGYGGAPLHHIGLQS